MAASIVAFLLVALICFYCFLSRKIKKEIEEEEIVKKYDSKFLVIPKNMIKHFNERILKLSNLNIIDLDHNELEFLKFKGLLDEDLIKPLYLS